MVAIVVRRTVDPSVAAVKKMIIATESGGLSFTVPYAPRDVDHGNRGRSWSAVERAGRTPILAPGGVPLSTQKFTLVLGKPDPDDDVEFELEQLELIAQSSERIVVQYGVAEGGLWRITDLQVTSSMRRPLDNARTRAEVEVELIEASDYLARVGPITGGAGTASPKPSTGGKPATSVRIYVVKKGDTLGKISQRFYKTPRRWRLIANANKIKNPKQTAKLRVGAKLRIPQLATKTKKRKK